MTTSEVEVRVRGIVAAVDGGHAERVVPLLTAAAAHFTTVGGVVTGKRGAVELYRRAADEVRFPAKLGWKVATALRASGVPVRLSGPAARFPPPDPAALAGLTGPAAALFAEPAARAGGLVWCGRGTRAEDLIPSILRLYPGCRAVVACKNRDVEATWLRTLGSAGLVQRLCGHAGATDPARN